MPHPKKLQQLTVEPYGNLGIMFQITTTVRSKIKTRNDFNQIGDFNQMELNQTISINWNSIK